MRKLNKSDIKMAQAACADGIFVIHDFPPHAWGESDTISKWLHDLDTFENTNGTSDSSATLGKPRHVDVTGAHAYVVIPTKLSYKKSGESVKGDWLDGASAAQRRSQLANCRMVVGRQLACH